MRKDRIDIITMGCSKNLVDSETLGRLFTKKGYKCVLDADMVEGETVVINTCGFIEDAKQESIDMILQFAEEKTRGTIKKLYVMGCLSQRYRKELEEEIPQVDRFYGKFDYKGLLNEMADCEKNNSRKESDGGNDAPKEKAHFCYIKISEGCDRHCAYCAIPLITGKHVSRPIEDILDEVKERVGEGITEFQIIAQELTYYGVDLYGERKLAELIERMSEIDGVKWIRLHYAYPNQFPMDVLRVMREKPNICKYLDVALQHVSSSVLQRMRRNTTKEETVELIKRIREEVPGITLRTTMMVGFPGETEEEFQELLDFVKWARFERLGAFSYSEEDGTYSAEHYEDNVPQEVKQARLDKLMRVQQRISAELQESMIGQETEVIVDRQEGDWYVARSEASSPEVDPEILIPVDEKELKIGEYYKVNVTGAEEFDLYATVVS